jgi:ribosomal protein S18 acetylase RimI-like enzyme
MNELTICLSDGERLSVRPMRATDADAMVATVLALSPESFRRRFFSPVPRLLPGMAEALTAVGDHHLALLAFDHAGQLVAIAEAIRERHDPQVAEVAIAVADAYQHRGLGTRLLRRLSRHAAEEGVARLVGFTQVDNAPALSLFTKAGAHTWLDEPGVFGFELPLVGSRVVAPLAGLGRAS